jgi:hypothetical protein
MSDLSLTLPHDISNEAKAGSSQVVSLAVCAFVSLAVFLFTMNWEFPWEGDQPAKAAQIMEIAETNDYLLSDKLVDHYKVRLFSFYFAASALLYKGLGREILPFMNWTSVVMGVIFVLALANSNWRLFRIHPGWTTFVLLSMPGVVTNFSYGNEVAWSLSLLTLSIMLATYKQPGLYYLSGFAYAAAVYCRVDLVLLAPFWLMWSVWVARPNEGDVVPRLIKMCVSGAAAGAMLWLLLLRMIPEANSAIGWEDRIKFIIAMLIYPFNPSVILLAIPGWIWLYKSHKLAALTLLLLLLQVVFYLGVLASPKYIMPITLAYGLVVPWLLSQIKWNWRTPAIGLIAIWLFFAASIYGVFGPESGRRWYLPTVDGPCPTGSYLSFYNTARQGEYQVKQQEAIDISKTLFEYIEAHPDAPPLVGYRPVPAFGYVAKDMGIKIPEKASVWAEPDQSVMLMIRPAYLFVARMRLNPQHRELFDNWVNHGQVRGVGEDADAALPSLIEFGPGIPEGNDYGLSERILFMNKYYQGHQLHKVNEFIPEYRSLTWVPVASVPAGAKPVYQDEEFAALEQPVEGGEVFGYVWPEAYYGERHPHDF